MPKLRLNYFNFSVTTLELIKDSNVRVTTKKVNVAKLDEVESQIKSGTATVSMDMLAFLKDWLVQHIMGTDPTYVPYLKTQDLEH